MSDQAPPPPDDTAAARSRRRSSRPWSNPAPAQPALPEPTTGEEDWASRRRPAPPRGRPPVAPPVLPSAAPPASGPEAGLAAVAEQLSALQAQVSALQESVGQDPAGVTGDELTAAIEALGNALGGGMATLLTEHRNLLARDVSQAADRILDEVGVRLRAATTSIVEGIEERVRALLARSVGELVDQVDLRLDKVQADVAGLRAVMLELPDQSGIVERLDEMSELVANAKQPSNRVTPAMANAIEKAMAGPIEQIEANVHTIVDVVRELLEERLPGGAPADEDAPAMPDAATIEALIAEMTALRRRISLRVAAEEPAPEEAEETISVTPDKPARQRGRRSRQID